MAKSSIRDILVSFSPSLDLFAITVGDGRIKVWNTAKGHLQTEFSDFASSEEINRLEKADGHLSLDYTCMKWFYLDKTVRPKKRKLGCSILVLGTRGGDVLALDVSAGQLKWRVNDCHPGGVTSVSFHVNTSHVFTAGADGVVCEIDSISGRLLNKFNATSMSISALAISPDGETIATAASQLRIFDCSSHKKLQKFSGHPEPVRCMVFSEDGKYVLSAASNERYVAMWKIDGSKNRQVTAVLSMDHPAVFLDVKSSNGGDNGGDAALSVLAVSEVGIGYFWHAENIDALRKCKPTKIYVRVDDETLKKHKGATPCVFLAKLQNVVEPASGYIFLAYGLLIKPTFTKVVVHSGNDVTLNISRDGILLPINQPDRPKKALQVSSHFTALDRSNMEAGLLPIPRIFSPADEKMDAIPMESKNNFELDSASFSVEERLRSLGILDNDAAGSTLDSKLLKGLTLDAATTQHRQVKATIISMEPKDAFNLLKGLIKAWETRSHDPERVLPWIYSVLLHHRDYVKFNDPKLFNSLYKVAESRGSSLSSLLQLSGRLQLVLAQVDKASNNGVLSVEQKDESNQSEDDDDEQEEDIVEDVYGIEDASETSSENAEDE